MKKIKKTKSISILGIIVCLLGVILFGTRTIAPEIFGNNTSSEVNTVNVENLENVIIKTGETITEDFISNNNTSLKTYFRRNWSPSCLSWRSTSRGLFIMMSFFLR